MIRLPAKMLGALSFGGIVIHTKAEALAQIGAGTVAQLCLSAGDIGNAVPDVSQPRWRMDRFGVRPKYGINQIDEFEQSGPTASGNVLDLAGSPRSFCRQETCLDNIVNVSEIAGLRSVAMNYWTPPRKHGFQKQRDYG